MLLDIDDPSQERNIIDPGLTRSLTVNLTSYDRGTYEKNYYKSRTIISHSAI